MITSVSQWNGTAFEFNYLAWATSSTFIRYCFSQGYSYNPWRNSTVYDVGGGSSNGTANNLGTSFYYPNRSFGVVHLNNPSNYNPGAGKTIYTGAASSNSFTAVVCWIQNTFNQQYGVDIIMGAYASSTHDWWFGFAPNYPQTERYKIAINGTVTASTIIPTVGRRYIAVFSNSYSLATGWAYIYDDQGNEWFAGVGGVQLSTAGNIGIGKYGDYVDNYMPNIYVTDFLFGPYVAAGNVGNFVKMFKSKLGFPVY